MEESEEEIERQVTENQDEIATAANSTAETADETTVLKVKITKQKAIEYIKRYAFLLVGLFIMSFGVAFSKKAALGSSPISSIPFVLEPITNGALKIGIATTIVNTLIVLLQIAILRKKFKWINLLQIPVCAAFGYLCQFAEWCISDIVLTAYWQQWLICITGIVLVAFGVSMEVTASVMTLAGEGLTLALCQVLPKIKFGFMKVIVDVSLVSLAVALSFIFLHRLYFERVRDGSAAAAVCVGVLARKFKKFMKPLGNKLFGSVQTN